MEKLVKYSPLLLFGLLLACLAKATRWNGEPPLKNRYEEHEFLAACREGNLPAVQYYLDHGGVTVNEYFRSGRSGDRLTGLFLAAQEGHVKLTEFLLRNGAFPNSYTLSQSRSVPLYFAAQNGHREIVDCLVDAGADPNATWWIGGLRWKTAWTAASHGRPLFRRWNPEKYDNYTEIMATLTQAKRDWQRAHQHAIQPTGNSDPIAPPAEPIVTEQTSLLSAMTQLSLSGK